MTREEVNVQFNGLAHEHIMVNGKSVDKLGALNGLTTSSSANMIKSNNSKTAGAECETCPSALSTIAILRRHPMYDSLVLVKRHRADGPSLEFPTSNADTELEKSQQSKVQKSKDCSRSKLVSLYLDGDDPMYQCQENKCKTNLTNDGELVYVPMNGLIDRLDNFERHGVSIDSRVYAFAMGLKTAEKFLTNSTMKEIQEAPQL